MSTNVAVDALFDVRNNYYIGAYQQCINHALNAKVKTEDEIIEKDTFLYRAYIALFKSSVPLSEIDPSTAAPSLKTIRRFADYTANPSKRKSILEEVNKELENSTLADDDVSLLVNSLIFTHEENIDDALRVLSKSSALECRAATINCLLKLSRVDLAIKEVKKMQEVDEDSTISQLALAWVYLSTGKDKLKDAFYIFQELIEKYGSTPSLLISQAASLIQQQKHEEAEKLLYEAQQRDINNPDILIGLVVVSQFLGKSIDVTNRYINQLKTEHPTHVWTKDYIAKEIEFENLAQASTS